MIIRSAILQGQVPEADRERFDAQMRGAVVQAISTYPGIRQVKLRKLLSADEGMAPTYMVFDLYFDSLAAMEAALASPTRQAVREQMKQAMSLFQGKVWHQVFEE
jgi:uncharacterized protein (TIGR02118 family)